MNINWSYIAGFVDGEGSIIKNGKNDYRVVIPQTHEGVLESIKNFTGMGNICKVAKRRAHWKESWVYCIARQEAALFFLRKIYPYLIVKKDIAQKIIPMIAKIVSNQHKNKLRLQKKIKACKFLRERGLSYRQIGKKLKVDHGYARRLILYK